jgi:hypothetical protein
MKNKNLLLIITLFFSTLTIFGQVPQRIDFQAMARDGSGNPLTSQNISVRMSIMEGSTTVYSEVHSLTTDDYGLFTLAIGEGTPISGDFTTIDWSTGNQKVKVEIDPNGGNSFVYMGTSELASVPYALYSANGSTWSQNGNDIYYNDGFVGIGTNSPEGSLHVPFVSGEVTSVFGSNVSTWTNSPNISIGGDDATLYIGRSDSDKAYFTWYSSDDYASIGTYSGNHPLVLQDAGGNAGVGSSFIPLVKFQVEEHWSDGVLGSDLGLEQYPNYHHSAAIYGLNTDATSNADYAYGVLGRSSSSDCFLSAGIYGEANQSATVSIGVWGYSNGNEDFNAAIYGAVEENASANYAGYFAGDVYVDGTLSKAGGSFKIDHPQDPANKYLIHSFVESPDMMNVYNGNVVTDANGMAEVELPSYFSAENKDFKYQLTVIGQFAQAIIKNEISDNRFTIQTDKPNVKVSWQVTGVRNDAWAKAHRIIPEVEKKDIEKGHYLHPELYGKSKDLGMPYSNHNLNKNKTRKPATKPLGEPTGPMGIRK